MWDIGVSLQLHKKPLKYSKSAIYDLQKTFF